MDLLFYCKVLFCYKVLFYYKVNLLWKKLFSKELVQVNKRLLKFFENYFLEK